MSRNPSDLVRLSEAEAQRLAKLYMEAELEILRDVDRAMARGNDLRYLRGMLDNVQAILEDLLTGNRQWCEQAIPRIYIEGAKFADELAGKAVAGFGAIHQQAVKVLADNTFDRLDSVRQVIGRRVEDVYRRYALEATRQSIIGYKTWQQVSREFRDNLRAEGITGFTDAAGRKWNMKTYADTVARTTTMEAHLIGTANRLLEHGHDLVKVSTHAGACELCQPWQGKILSLTGATPGYPTLEDARGTGLFHPRCRHAYGLYIDLDAEIEELERDLGEKSLEGERGKGGPTSQRSSVNIPAKSIPDAAKSGIRQAMSDALAHGFKTQTECLLTLDAATGEAVYNQVNGVADHVQFPEELVDLLNKASVRSIVLIHNHPSSAAFSDADIGLLGEYGSIQGLFVTGHDGTHHFIGKTDSTRALERDSLTLDYQKYLTKYFKHYKDLVVGGKMKPEDAWKEHTHRMMQDIAQANRLEYARWSQP